MRGAKIDKISLGEDWGPFSAPGGRSRQSKTGILQETSVRTLSVEPKLGKLLKQPKSDPKLPKPLKLPRALLGIYNYPRRGILNPKLKTKINDYAIIVALNVF